MRTSRAGLAVVAISILAVAGPAAAQSPAASSGAGPVITPVVTGLDSPRGVAVTADGTLYVAESGAGGTDPCITHPELGHVCFGATGGISKVTGGTATRIVDGLMSAITDTGETFGPSDVIVAADGTIWYLTGGPAAGAAETRAMVTGGEGIGQLWKLGADGKSVSVADLAAFESANNPDAAQPGNALPDSNANGLAASDAGVLVADAGANDLLVVGPDGAISVAAVFPITFMPLPPDPTASADPGASPAMLPMDPVPTAVAVGPDGAYYVGQLTGFPFPAGGASVWRVVAGEEPTVYASGFTNITDVAFGADGSLYVLEIAHDGLLAAAPGTLPEGGLWKVPAGGGTPELLVSQGLPMPGGLAVADDGTVYVSTCAVCPDGGSIVSIAP
jgi:hypothetical protein